MNSKHFFNLDKREGGIQRNLAPGIDTTVYAGKQAMVSVVRFEPGSAGQIHSHPEEQWGFCQSGSGIRIQDGERVAVSKGDFWLTPGDVRHAMQAGDKGMVVIDVFAPPRGLYKTQGSGFAADDT